MRKRFIWLFLMIGLLAACSRAEGPEQIASYPRDEPIAVYPRNSETLVIYNATLDLQVSDVERAAERAKEIAFDHNGYLVSAQSWYQDGEKHTTVVLAVPAFGFDPARSELLRLGSLVGEWVSSELISTSESDGDTYSHITVYLHPKDFAWPEISLPKWRPVRTFEKAWGVFISIFGVLLDMVIWVAVVAGPFLLIGWGIKRFIQWQQKR